MRPKSGTAERRIGLIARRQHGVVTREQLLIAGVTDAQIRRRLRNAGLIQVHRGVYRVGHGAPSVLATYMSAVLACGEGAVLSGRSAAHLLGLTKRSALPPEVAARTNRRVEGVTYRRVRLFDPRDATTWTRIPVTTVPRTLVDLAAVLRVEDLARACHEAGVLHWTTPRQVEAALARRPNSPGAAKLRRVLRGEERVTLSKLERTFLALLTREGFPLPQTNRVAGEHRVDCRWSEHGLTVELDSYRYHGSRHAWEQDRKRERAAYARGDQFRRYTYGDVFEDTVPMLAELRELLAA